MNQYELNKAIEAFIAERDARSGGSSPDEQAYIRR
jgi:hypothetical protein